MPELGEGQDDVTHRAAFPVLHAFFFDDLVLGSVVSHGAQRLDCLFATGILVARLEA